MREFEKKVNRKDARRGRYQTSSARMGVTDLVRTNEGWQALPLHRQPKTELNDDTGLLVNTAHGRMY